MPMPKVITVSTYKGGVGKTTTAISMAGILAQQDYCVLVIDMDPSGNATSALGIDRDDPELIGIEQVFIKAESTDVNDIIITKPIKEVPTLDLIPSTKELGEKEDTFLNLIGKEFKLQLLFKENEDSLKMYDYIIIDTHPNVGIINQNALIVSDNVIMTTTPDISAVSGIKQFCDQWDKIRISLRIEDNISAVVITRVDVRNSIDKNFYGYLKQTSKDDGILDILTETSIPLNVSLREAPVKHKPINIYAPESAGAIAYKNLVEELKKKGVL